MGKLTNQERLARLERALEIGMGVSLQRFGVAPSAVSPAAQRARMGAGSRLARWVGAVAEMALGLITVAYSNRPNVTATVDADSWLTVDGVKVGSGGDRPLYTFGGRDVHTGFRENHLVPSSEVTSLGLSAGTLSVVVTTGGVAVTTAVTVDAASVLTVDGPSLIGGGWSFINRETTVLPLVNATSVAYAASSLS